ncbi:MAG: pilus assembly protein TadG-related protein, partial [Pseudomonadota bacterium]
MAIDFMRHEAARTDLQNALDRGVLAAASSTQSIGALTGTVTEAEATAANKALIESYMRARSYARVASNVAVTPTPAGLLGPGERVVQATAQETISTFFLSLIGRDDILVPTASSARSVRREIEIAFVIDVSGSMGDPDPDSSANLSKIESLRSAASRFVDRVMGQVPDAEQDQVLISVVPYSAHTSVTPEIAAFYGFQGHPTSDGNGGTVIGHTHSYCAEFDPGDHDPAGGATNPDFTRLDIPKDTYFQYQHFRDHQNQFGEHHACPAANNRTTPFLSSAEAVKAAFNALTLEGHTTLYNGVKWGAHFLDVSSRDLLAHLQGLGLVWDQFAGWPNAPADANVQKALIILTDGINTRQMRLDDAVYGQQTLEHWDARWDQEAEENPDAEVWIGGDAPDGHADGNALTRAICDTAKSTAAGITIYTIGYDLDDEGARALLRDCASNEDGTLRFYDVSGGLTISEALEDIAAQINVLRLTQ